MDSDVLPASGYMIANLALERLDLQMGLDIMGSEDVGSLESSSTGLTSEQLGVL